MLYCKKLDENAVMPTVNYPGEDLAFDFYALENTVLNPRVVTKVKTGIAARFIKKNSTDKNYGLLLRDRSSMAIKGITVSAGVVDAGYSNEILVLLTNNTNEPYYISKGNKIVQAIPVEVLTENGVEEVEQLPESIRKEKGFGSSGI